MTPGNEDGVRPKHFSMIRDFRVADLFTLSNGFAGMGAVLALMKYQASGEAVFLKLALALFPVALFFDVADGRIARSRGEATALGQELDSLADVVSFGVAPAALAFAVGMQSALDAVVLVFFVGCGISRLARYNVTASTLADAKGKVRYFEGTPIPTSLVLVLAVAILFAADRLGRSLPFGEISVGPLSLHPLVLLYAASGSAMISKTLRIPKP